MSALAFQVLSDEESVMHRAVPSPKQKPAPRPRVKAVKMKDCQTCRLPYPQGSYMSHLNDAEHARALWLKSGTTRF